MHDCFCSRVGQAAPPLAAAVVTVRVDVCEPPPHTLEQAENEDHADTTQSTGHA